MGTSAGRMGGSKSTSALLRIGLLPNMSREFAVSALAQLKYPLVHWCMIDQVRESKTCGCAAAAAVATGRVSPEHPA